MSKQPSSSNPTLSTPQKPNVRYLGFDSVDDGRCLRFSVSGNGIEPIAITAQISDSVFNRIPGLSFQDAAPMLYDKITHAIAAHGTLDEENLVLTKEDVAEYLKRHATRKKYRTRRFDKIEFS